MIKKIDLHGLSHEKALVQVEEFLLMNSFGNDLELELITGKSPKLQEKIINQMSGNLHIGKSENSVNCDLNFWVPIVGD